jgi:hypothetical protein
VWVNVLPDACCVRAAPDDAGGGVPVHPGAGADPQQRAGDAVAGELVDGAGDRGRQWHEGAGAAFAVDEHDPVAVFHAQVADVDGTGL